MSIQTFKSILDKNKSALLSISLTVVTIWVTSTSIASSPPKNTSKRITTINSPCTLSLIESGHLRFTLSFEEFMSTYTQDLEGIVETPIEYVDLPAVAKSVIKSSLAKGRPVPYQYEMLNAQNISKFIGNNIFVVKEGEMGIRMHKSSHAVTTYGDPVYTAGEIALSHSRINPGFFTIKINNQSGTYRPPLESLVFFLDLIVDLQLPIDIVLIDQFIDSPGRRRGKSLPRFKVIMPPLIR